MFGGGVSEIVVMRFLGKLRHFGCFCTYICVLSLPDDFGG